MDKKTLIRQKKKMIQDRKLKINEGKTVHQKKEGKI